MSSIAISCGSSGAKQDFLGQVFGTVVTLFTGLPITDITASSANAVGAKDRGEGALSPAMTYEYYLGLPPADMRQS